MAKKGQIFQQYTKEFKLTAVKAYVEGSSSYKVVSDKVTTFSVKGSDSRKPTCLDNACCSKKIKCLTEK